MAMKGENRQRELQRDGVGGEARRNEQRRRGEESDKEPRKAYMRGEEERREGDALRETERLLEARSGEETDWEGS